MNVMLWFWPAMPAAFLGDVWSGGDGAGLAKWRRALGGAVGSSRRLGAQLPGRGTYKTEGSRKLVSALVGQKP